MQAYGIYVGNFKNAQDTVIRLKAEKNSKFNGWVQEVAQKHQDGYDLLTLISLPVNHIAKMEPLLEQLASLAVGYDQIEVENLNNASSMIRETSKFVTQNLLHSDNTAVITNVQRRITGYFKPLNLIKPDRKFMMETQFTTLADKKKIYLFLFNDILLVTIPQKNLFKFKDIVLLDLVQFEDMKSEKNAFILKTPNEILKLVAKTSEDKQQWVKILSSLEESRKVNRTIGVGIQEILDRESSQSPRDGSSFSFIFSIDYALFIIIIIFIIISLLNYYLLFILIFIFLFICFFRIIFINVIYNMKRSKRDTINIDTMY